MQSRFQWGLTVSEGCWWMRCWTSCVAHSRVTAVAPLGRPGRLDVSRQLGRQELSRALYFFFFQAEDGIRDVAVTGVQTCALPISLAPDEDGVYHFVSRLAHAYQGR